MKKQKGVLFMKHRVLWTDGRTSWPRDNVYANSSVAAISHVIANGAATTSTSNS